MSERPVTEFVPARPADDSSGLRDASEPRALVIDWETARLKAILPRVVGRTMSYSALTCFDDALVASVRRFYGLDVDVATAETEILEDEIERVRFFPWFLWDFGKSAGAETVGDRFLADGDLEPVERRILAALCDTVVDFWEVVGVQPDGVRLRALGTGGAVFVDDTVLGEELELGQILQGRIVVVAREDAPAEDEGIALIDAIYAVLPTASRASVVAEIAATIVDAGGDPLAVRIALKTRAPDLIDFAEYALDTLTEHETITNTDGEAVVLCATIVPQPPAVTEAMLAAAVERDGLPFTSDAALGAWVWRESGRVIGFVAKAPGKTYLEVGAASRERLTRAIVELTRAGIQTPALHAEETLERAAASWVATGRASAHLTVDPDVQRAFDAWLAGRWVDAPHPSLGDRSPRQAVHDQALRPALEQLLERLDAIGGRSLRAELGL